MKICKQAMALLAGVTLSASAALAAPLVYVPNEKSGTISVIDTAKAEVVAEIKAGKKPRGRP
jgi:YVTN family beta-propeller protein